MKLNKPKNAILFMSKLSTIFSREKLIFGRRRLFNSLWAILFGLILSSIFILFSGDNLINVFSSIISGAFINQKNVIWTSLLIYVLAALAVAIGFKAGLFNIGVSGQMMIGGMVSFMILIATFNGSKEDSEYNHWFIPLALLAAIASGFLLAGLAGFLKAYFNVHEVVSTIILNFIVLFFANFVLKMDIFQSIVSTDELGRSRQIFDPEFFESEIWFVIAIILAILVSTVIWFVLKKTVFGYKIRAIGINKNAAKYSGTNEKLLTIGIMAISGAMAGLAGFFYYFVAVSSEQIDASNSAKLLSVGFESIAIALLAYNHPFGILISSLFIGTLNIGSSNLSGSFDPDSYQIIIGIIIYFAAIAIIFEKFKPITKICNWWVYSQHPRYKELKKENTTRFNQLKTNYQKQKNQYQTIKLKNKTLWNSILISEKNVESKVIKQFQKQHKIKNIFELDKKVILDYYSKVANLKREIKDKLVKSDYFFLETNKSIYKTITLELKRKLINVRNEIISYSFPDENNRFNLFKYISIKINISQLDHFKKRHSQYKKNLANFKNKIKQTKNKTKNKIEARKIVDKIYLESIKTKKLFYEFKLELNEQILRKLEVK